MSSFSIVIVAKNAADKIGRLLESLSGLSDDVIICDTGSSDNTISIAQQAEAKVYSIRWEGCGKSKNAAIAFAKYDWILSLDSDEKIDPVMYKTLKQWQPASEYSVYRVLWKTFLGEKWIRYGEWSGGWKNRLFNKKIVRWDYAIAHEDITSTHRLTYHKLPGYLEHYSFDDIKHYISKIIHSAMITAQEYHNNGKKTFLIKMMFSPLFGFIKGYFLRLGFLDGYKGWIVAVTSAYYRFIKYARLYELNKKKKQ